MKRMGVLLAVVLVAASILSGCIIVPVEGGYGERYRHHRGGYYPYHPGRYYPYYPGWSYRGW